MRRSTLVTVCATTLAAATLAGCATTAPTSRETASTSAAPVARRTPPATSSSPAAATAAPATVSAAGPSAPAGDPSTAAPVAGPTAAATAPVSALAQHVFDECSEGAAAAGVRLTFTADPSGYTAADGHHQLVYPFEFLDGHDDPWAVYNCALTDDTVTSTFIGGGLTDSH